MNQHDEDLVEHRILIDACLRNRVPFFWRTPGTLLIARRGITDVIRTLTNEGHVILGLEAFEMNPEIHPRLDLIFDASRSAGSPLSAAESWPGDVWVDVTMTKGH